MDNKEAPSRQVGGGISACVYILTLKNTTVMDVKEAPSRGHVRLCVGLFLLNRQVGGL